MGTSVIELIQHNIQEEQGGLDDEDLRTLDEEYEIKRRDVDGIRHTELYSRLTGALRSKYQAKYQFDPRAFNINIGERFAEKFTEKLNSASMVEALAMISLAGESLVSKLYQPIFKAVKKFTNLTPKEYAFLPLHIGVDEQHAADLENILLKHLDEKENRRQVISAVKFVLELRLELLDSLEAQAVNFQRPKAKAGSSRRKQMKRIFSLAPAKAAENSSEDSGQGSDLSMQNNNTYKSGTLYNKQSNNWVRNEPTILSDFTAREKIYDILDPYIRKSRVLDVGCGEGYVARCLRKRGAEYVLGVDGSRSMILAASEEEGANRLGGLDFVVGNAVGLHEILKQKNTNFTDNYFDISVAVFLFNYVTVDEMKKIGQQIYNSLKPGGQFVFSVPHPVSIFNDTDKFAWDYKVFKQFEGYFGSIDESIPGIIKTNTGKALHVRMMYKIFQTYIEFLNELGFKIELVHECTVTDEIYEENPTFFAGLKGKPLHVIFRAEKVMRDDSRLRNELVNLEEMSQKLWKPSVMKNGQSAFKIEIPEATADVIYDFVKASRERIIEEFGTFKEILDT